MTGFDIATGIIVVALLVIGAFDRSSRIPWDTQTDEQLKSAHRKGLIR